MPSVFNIAPHDGTGAFLFSGEVKSPGWPRESWPCRPAGASHFVDGIFIYGDRLFLLDKLRGCKFYEYRISQ